MKEQKVQQKTCKITTSDTETTSLSKKPKIAPKKKAAPKSINKTQSRKNQKSASDELSRANNNPETNNETSTTSVPKADLKKQVEERKEQKHYSNFDFYFKRTSFRTMTLYFKTAFKPYFEKWRAQKKPQPVANALLDFAKREFPALVENLSAAESFEFVELLKLLVFSHRHNKNDAYLADPLISFSIVREPMYKYSKHA